MQLNCGLILVFWDQLEPVVALLADEKKGNTSFQQFEYMVIQARRWQRRYPAGDFPKSIPRIPLTNKWRDADALSHPSSVQ